MVRTPIYLEAVWREKLSQLEASGRRILDRAGVFKQAAA